MRVEFLSRRHPRAKHLAVEALIALLVAGCLSTLTIDMSPTGRAVQVKFILNKKKHARSELECWDCHEDVKKKEKPGIPERDLCMDCHEDFEADEGEESDKSDESDGSGATMKPDREAATIAILPPPLYIGVLRSSSLVQ